MVWPLKVFLIQLVLTMGMALIIYIIWRITHPGQKW